MSVPGGSNEPPLPQILSFPLEILAAIGEQVCLLFSLCSNLTFQVLIFIPGARQERSRIPCARLPCFQEHL